MNKLTSHSGSPRKDDWSNALGLGGDEEDDDGSVEALSPSGTPSRVRDALLAAARLEVQKLGEMNRKLVQAKLAAENESISKAEYEAALTRHNEAWASKVAEIELEVTKTKEQLATMQIQNEILSREVETSRLELDETKIANRELESSLVSRTSNQQQTTDEGSWLKLLPRRHSSPGVCTQQDNNLVCLGSWASFSGHGQQQWMMICAAWRRMTSPKKRRKSPLNNLLASNCWRRNLETSVKG